MTMKADDSATALATALRKSERSIMKLPGVTGVALTEVDGRPHIAVYVEQLTKNLRAKIPNEVDGVPVKIEVSGAFKAF